VQANAIALEWVNDEEKSAPSESEGAAPKGRHGGRCCTFVLSWDSLGLNPAIWETIAATGWRTDGSKRDFSTARADAFTGVNAKKRRRPAPVEMTVFGRLSRW
jgi:hypothetical protein